MTDSSVNTASVTDIDPFLTSSSDLLEAIAEELSFHGVEPVTLEETDTEAVSEVTVDDVEDVDDAFDALVDDATDTDTAEHVDDINDEFDRLVNDSGEPEPEAPVEEPHSDIISETSLPLPVNSLSSLTEDSSSRFSGAIWFETVGQQQVSIIGQGGIGSWATLVVARLNIKSLETYDGDTVENVNMAGQMFSRDDIGQNKASAVYNRIYNLCDYFYYSARSRRYEGEPMYPIVIGALDNMEARSLIFREWQRKYIHREDALFIDGRLSADEFQIFAIRGTDTDRMAIYRDKWLFPDSEAEQTLCSFKQTTYMATMIASFIGNVIVNHCANLANPDVMFDLPFYINYNAEMMYLKTTES